MEDVTITIVFILAPIAFGLLAVSLLVRFCVRLEARRRERMAAMWSEDRSDEEPWPS